MELSCPCLNLTISWVPERGGERSPATSPFSSFLQYKDSPLGSTEWSFGNLGIAGIRNAQVESLLCCEDFGPFRVFSCHNCGVKAYVSGQMGPIAVNKKLINASEAARKRASTQYSQIFGIVLEDGPQPPHPPSSTQQDRERAEEIFSELGKLVDSATERERRAMEQRIREFEAAQQEEFRKFKHRANRERHAVLSKSISNPRPAASCPPPPPHAQTSTTPAVSAMTPLTASGLSLALHSSSLPARHTTAVLKPNAGPPSPTSLAPQHQPLASSLRTDVVGPRAAVRAPKGRKVLRFDDEPSPAPIVTGRSLTEATAGFAAAGSAEVQLLTAQLSEQISGALSMSIFSNQQQQQFSTAAAADSGSVVIHVGGSVEGGVKYLSVMTPSESEPLQPAAAATAVVVTVTPPADEATALKQQTNGGSRVAPPPAVPDADFRLDGPVIDHAAGPQSSDSNSGSGSGGPAVFDLEEDSLFGEQPGDGGLNSDDESEEEEEEEEESESDEDETPMVLMATSVPISIPMRSPYARQPRAELSSSARKKKQTESFS